MRNFFGASYLSVFLVALLVLPSCGKKGNVSDMENVVMVQQISDNKDNKTDYFFIQDTINNLVGVSDKDGNILLEPKYLGLRSYFSDQPDKPPFMRVVSADTLYGIVNFKGETLIKPTFENPIDIVKDIVTGESYFKSCKTIVPNKEYKITLPDGESRVLTDSEPRYLYGVYDMNGKEIVPFKYESVDTPIDGYFRVERKIDLAGSTLEGLMKDGKYVLDPDYSGIQIERSGKGAVARIRPKRGVNYTETYLIDFKNGNKKTKFYCDRWGDGNISRGWVVKTVSTTNERGSRVNEKEYYDFSGNRVNVDVE